MIVPNLLIASFLSPFDEGDTARISLIMLSWMITILIVALYMRQRGIRIDGFEEVSANHARMTPQRMFRLGIAILALMVAFSIWLSQAGVNQFDSAKRVRDAGQWFNLANALIGVFLMHSIVVLSLFRLRVSNPHIVMAVLSFAVIFLIGYMSGSRGLFTVPIMTIFFLRLVQISSAYKRTKLLIAFSALSAFTLVVMALISANRQGDEGIAVGFQIFGEQLSNSASGYGISPVKDAIIWEYSEQRRIPEVGIVLLGGFYGLVPRTLWPSKPTFVSTGPIAGAFVFREMSYVDQGAGIPVSMPSEIALAFGSAWFMPGFIAAGLLMALVAVLFQPYPFLIFASFTFYSGLMSHGLPKSQVALLLDVVTLLILVWVVGFRFVRINRQQARAAARRKNAAHT